MTQGADTLIDRIVQMGFSVAIDVLVYSHSVVATGVIRSITSWHTLREGKMLYERR